MRPDPIAGSPQSPQSFNRYAYAQNNPVNFADRTGLTLEIPGFCSAQFSSCGGGGERGSGFSGTPFDDSPFGSGGMPASVAQALSAYLGRLQNTYAAISATLALQRGDSQTAYAIMAANHTLYFSDDPPPDEDGQEGRLFKGYESGKGSEGDIGDFIAAFSDWLASMSEEKRIQAGNKKGMIMNLNGTPHFHTSDGKPPTGLFDRDYLGHRYYPPNQQEYCPPGQTCIGPRTAPCNTWPNGCWSPDFERDENGASIVRAPSNPAPFYYFNFQWGH